MNLAFEHKEAFCLMNYTCENEHCGHSEMIWNSRDGVTPYSIRCRKCGQLANHVKWHQDKRIPNHLLKSGDLYFTDITLEQLISSVKKRLDGNHYEASEGKKEEKAREIASSGWYKGMPCIRVYEPILSPWRGQMGTLAMPLLSNVPKGHKGWELIECPVCGTECWKRPGQEKLEAKGLKIACTACALQKRRK